MGDSEAAVELIVFRNSLFQRFFDMVKINSYMVAAAIINGNSKIAYSIGDFLQVLESQFKLIFHLLEVVSINRSHVLNMACVMEHSDVLSPFGVAHHAWRSSEFRDSIDIMLDASWASVVIQVGPYIHDDIS